MYHKSRVVFVTGRSSPWLDPGEVERPGPGEQFVKIGPKGAPYVEVSIYYVSQIEHVTEEEYNSWVAGEKKKKEELGAAKLLEAKKNETKH